MNLSIGYRLIIMDYGNERYLIGATDIARRNMDGETTDWRIGL
jgi:hypothetical protein